VKRVGAHVSTQGGVENAPLNAKRIGARTFGLFTSNPRRWAAPALTAANIEQFQANMRRLKFAPEHVLVHAGYLLNFANADTAQRRATWDAFADEAARCAQLGLSLLVVHPGMLTGQTTEKRGIAWAAGCVNRALNRTNGVTVVLENTATRTSLGRRFEQLAAIIEKVDDQARVGVCLDTCHAFGAGYDVRDAAGFRETIRQLDGCVGLHRVKGMHLNDSKAAFAGGVDRHASLGRGTIGWECFRTIMTDPRFDAVPMIIETPDKDLWPAEIRKLYRLAV
jgi:deoxyribonuclease-4